MEDLLEQFQHLLQPMRDLEQNWSVDLAEELTQAFSVLSERCIQFGQQGDTIMDFGKAALFIQGGANVYSKKVWRVLLFIYRPEIHQTLHRVNSLIADLCDVFYF